MHETIVKLASAITMAGTGEAETTLLDSLCTAAETDWTRRLRQGVTPSECGSAFVCAAAFTAAAGMMSAGSGGVTSFTAGDVSVRCGGSGGESGPKALLTQAERLMAPYTEADDFAFYGVRA